MGNSMLLNNCLKPLLLIFVFNVIFSCNHLSNSNKDTDITAQPPDSIKEAMVKKNRLDMQEEASIISSFINRRKWKMETSGTGLRYWIYEKGTGKVSPKKDDFATVAYTLYTLDGTLCYKVTADKPEIFQLGKATITHGLEEGVTYMVEGDKARLIVPKHLGYGMMGDSKNVPPNAILFYDVQLLSVK